VSVPDPMAAPPLRWGILAPGGIAHRFAREVTQYTQSQIVAVGSRDLERATRFIDEELPGSGVRAYGSYAEMITDQWVQAVYIASPHSEHLAHATLALQVGKPVLVEKAFTLNAQQATQIFTLASEKQLFVMEAMWSRFLPHYQAIKALVDSGELGEITSIVGMHSQALDLTPTGRLMNPALGGGALLDLGVYPISLIHWLWGKPTRIKATGTLSDTGVDLRESVSLWYGDRLALAYADMESAGKSSLQIVGTQASLEVEDWFYTPQNIIHTSRDGVRQELATQVEGGFQYQVAEVARCITSGHAMSPIMPWTHTVEVLQIMDEVRHQLGVKYPSDVISAPALPTTQVDVPLGT